MNNDTYEEEVENLRKSLIEKRKKYYLKKNIEYPKEEIKFYAYDQKIPVLDKCSDCGGKSLEKNHITEGCNMSGDGNGFGFYFCKDCGFRIEFRWRD